MYKLRQDDDVLNGGGGFICYNGNMKSLILILVVALALGACSNRTDEGVLGSFTSGFANAVSGAPDRFHDGMKVRHSKDTQQDPQQETKESE